MYVLGRVVIGYILTSAFYEIFNATSCCKVPCWYEYTDIHTRFDLDHEVESN